MGSIVTVKLLDPPNDLPVGHVDPWRRGWRDSAAAHEAAVEKLVADGLIRATDSAWLIELQQNPPQWWKGGTGQRKFTHDPNEAVRFLRREDAEAARLVITEGWYRYTPEQVRAYNASARNSTMHEYPESFVTEHIWVDAPKGG